MKPRRRATAWISIFFLAGSIALPECAPARPDGGREALYPEAPEEKQRRAPRLLEARKIWDRAPHSAFTDLIRHRGRWICVFREGKKHVSPDGALRIIASEDTREWRSLALLEDERGDLRDAKITLTPGGKLQLTGAVALTDGGPVRHRSRVWFSEDGETWDAGTDVADPNFWLWRVTWRKDLALGVAYQTGGTRSVRLYSSEDGRRFETLVEDLGVKGYPNEGSIIFGKDGEALCLLRRDPDPGLLGSARPPYREWTWKSVGTRIGGPHLIRLPDGRLVAATRLYDGKVRTSLSWLDPETGKLTEFLKLPSGGDTSYPGLVWHEGKLVVSYYSSHEGKTSIYLATVEIPTT